MTNFYLGTHLTTWLWKEEFPANVPLFISHHGLRHRVSRFPRARVGSWALDSGGFSEIKANGGWTITPEQYVASANRYVLELGPPDWMAQQDWMCEPMMIAKTGLSVLDHQKRTVANFHELCDLAPHLPIIPVLQGWVLDDYLGHIQMFEDSGVRLAEEPVVGVGSVCRRQDTYQAAEIFKAVAGYGIRIHGFGVKRGGFIRAKDYLASADSMAWSFGGRYKNGGECPEGKKNCANCLHYALAWREDLLAALPQPI